MAITTIGLDLAKSVFQAHGIDETGAKVLAKRLHRNQMLPFFSKLPPCLIGVEACGTAHYWARTLAAMGHEVRLIPPSYVKAYPHRHRAICRRGPPSRCGLRKIGPACLPLRKTLIRLQAEDVVQA